MLMVHTAMAAMTGAGLGGSGPTGQRLFNTQGTNQSFIVPALVTSICVVSIGRGGQWNIYYDDQDNPYLYDAGAGGGLAYRNDIPVTPGEELIVPIQGSGNVTGVRRGVDWLCGAWSANGSTRGGPLPGFTGFYGGRVGYVGDSGIGGGAAGFISDGGDGSSSSPALYGGGGTAPYGGALTGASGGGAGWSAGPGGQYGGGAGFGSLPGDGCVYIIWGPDRSFPNNNTGGL